MRIEEKTRIFPRSRFFKQKQFNSSQNPVKVSLIYTVPKRKHNKLHKAHETQIRTKDPLISSDV